MLLIQSESVLAFSALFFWPFQAQESKGHVIFTKVWIGSWENHIRIQDRLPFLARSSGNFAHCPVGHFSDESLSPGMLTVKLMAYLYLLLLLILSSGLYSSTCTSDMEIETVDLNDAYIGCVPNFSAFWVFFFIDIAWCRTVSSKSNWTCKLLLNMYAIALDIKCKKKRVIYFKVNHILSSNYIQNWFKWLFGLLSWTCMATDDKISKKWKFILKKNDCFNKIKW